MMLSIQDSISENSSLPCVGATESLCDTLQVQYICCVLSWIPTDKSGFHNVKNMKNDFSQMLQLTVYLLNDFDTLLLTRTLTMVELPAEMLYTRLSCGHF